MDINQLKSFVAVAHQGNLTQAAETLHLSQPAVSAQIKAVEKNLNITLFERNAQGMTLTRAGEIFLPHAEAALQQMHRLDLFAASLADDYVQTLDIGLIYPIPGEKTAALTQALTRTAPALQIRLHYGLSGDIINSVRKKELDGGFFLGSNPYRNVSNIGLGDVGYVLVCPAALKDQVENGFPHSLNDIPWIEMSSFSGSHRHVLQLWQEYRIKPHGSVVCDQQAVLADMVAAGLGVALISAHDAANALKLGKAIHIVSIPPRAVTLSFVYPADHGDDDKTVLLKKCVRQVWADADLSP